MAPQNSNPPKLPPTVEEAYRRKCIQLKQRSKEIEETNDAYRLRLARLKRQIQKARLERAILLEQIAKRTSTNVEDSEGSPSPPPTPEDKPLRIKRGHRKPSLVHIYGGANTPSAAFMADPKLNNATPISDAFSHSQVEVQPPKEQPRGAANGLPKPPKRPSNAFEIYCIDTRPVLQANNKEKIASGEFRLEEELARGWKDLPGKEKDEYQTRYEHELVQWKEARDNYKRDVKHSTARDRSRARDPSGRGSRPRFEDTAQDTEGDEDQDVEMAEAEIPGRMPSGDQDTDPETEVEENEVSG
ncbi:hypothetical protein F4778DRAFT_735071 [Xylariomycetidae sp. FL2044]|nr:hypothetical protein F4778DRAFT_735071 [Xylariomycetidae sp. FL2044]